MLEEMIKQVLLYLDKFDMESSDCADVKAVYDFLKIIPLQMHEPKDNLLLKKAKQCFL